MRIQWVGVPKEARPELRKQLRKLVGTEWLVCSERGRDQKARAYIRESLWAFNTSFVASHTRCSLNTAAVEALSHAQGKLCEDANELVFGLLRSFKRFAEDAIAADGHGHFLASYDGNERELTVGETTFYAYRQ